MTTCDRSLSIEVIETAISIKESELVSFLLDTHFFHPTASGRTLFHFCVATAVNCLSQSEVTNIVDIAKQLLAKGMSPKERDSVGRTALELLQCEVERAKPTVDLQNLKVLLVDDFIHE